MNLQLRCLISRWKKTPNIGLVLENDDCDEWSPHPDESSQTDKTDKLKELLSLVDEDTEVWDAEARSLLDQLSDNVTGKWPLRFSTKGGKRKKDSRKYM